MYARHLLDAFTAERVRNGSRPWSHGFDEIRKLGLVEDAVAIRVRRGERILHCRRRLHLILQMLILLRVRAGGLLVPSAAWWWVRVRRTIVIRAAGRSIVHRDDWRQWLIILIQSRSIHWIDIR